MDRWHNKYVHDSVDRTFHAGSYWPVRAFRLPTIYSLEDADMHLASLLDSPDR